MERRHGTNNNIDQNEIERIKHPKPCEIPYRNGSKPVEQSRTPEVQKKHIRRDGKK